MRVVLVIAALLLPLPFAEAAPEQVHLGLPTSDAARTMSILWVDLQPEDAPHVTLDTPAGPRTLAATEVLGPGLGHQYEANATDLSPNTTYRYHLGDASSSFTTAPLDPAASFSFVALGDMGTMATATATEQAIEAVKPDFVLHSGDLSYAEGRQNEWISWFNLIAPTASTRPWITALGNHETYTGSSLIEAVPAFTGDENRVVSPVEIAFYHQRFGLPGNELWYSFDWGGAHFIALDTFSAPSIPDEETAWLDADLASHANATWKIVFEHEPAYSSGVTHGSSARVQQTFVPIFEKHHVDLVIAAHEHNYERMKPQNGVLYLVSGGGGEGTYAFGAEKEFTAARNQGYHVTSIRVTPARLEGAYVGTDGQPYADSFAIDKTPPKPSPTASPGAAKTPDTQLGAALALLVLIALVARRSQ